MKHCSFFAAGDQRLVCWTYRATILPNKVRRMPVKSTFARAFAAIMVLLSAFAPRVRADVKPKRPFYRGCDLSA